MLAFDMIFVTDFARFILWQLRRFQPGSGSGHPARRPSDLCQRPGRPGRHRGRNSPASQQLDRQRSRERPAGHRREAGIRFFKEMDKFKKVFLDADKVITGGSK